ncbi:ABC transporter ATP-binding protein [Mycobacterium sp. CVI_P3]|uniref:ABC transporter ATP-binding protein n=1 Tax=Mycobacterium pinniadriaticum TaxID=2994102 RepID=A0ABT3SBM8_9MYCO|nr:ABC transporter ATP-binding protein [Mycobacterium pinniadriaticum]MCX2930484.1 ABC transporter ATP-binding protein [Mycobacterium pinniadriaticum]MCX2936908.1 ABC transporter ATP-binding protein [Mycobacterium pinniadriaticum]
MTASLLQVSELTVHYPAGSAGLLGRRRSVVHAVEQVSLTVAPGEIVALVGESGCGKSTVARAIAGVQRASGGSVCFEDTDLIGLRGSALQPYRRAIQLIHQDPYDSLDPRMTVRSIVDEGLRIHRIPRRERAVMVRGALERVGLAGDWVLDRFPHELSGGQRQRVAIAAAVALTPRLLIADEPVSMLDVSVRASVLNLIGDLRGDGLAVLLITHDLASAVVLADHIAVMYFGRIVEEGPARELLRRPAHPYTRALLSAMPSADPAVRTDPQVVHGELPDVLHPPQGCAFASRCPVAEPACGEQIPVLSTVGEGRRAACLRVARSAGPAGDDTSPAEQPWIFQ